MIIGNPLYDSIFKYLMEDTTSAKRLIGVLIGEEIETLTLAAQEQIRIEPTYPLALFRMDFIATIQTTEGHKKVLIEVQKAKRETDISRFRSYLGKQYADKKTLLPIITIYFLGYDLKNIPESVVKVERNVRGLLSGEEYHVRNEFVELLTHEAYLIQVGKLKRPLQSPLERVLSIFDQSNQLEEKYFLFYPDEEIPEEVLPLVKRLQSVTREDTIREELELEAELEYEYRMTIGKREAELEQARSQLSDTQSQLDKARQEADALLRQAVVSLSQAGLSPQKIASALNIEVDTVHTILEAS